MSETRDSGSHYIGLMSGTSMDGIDAALVKFGDHQCFVSATLGCPYPDELKATLLTASRNPEKCTIDRIGQLDHWIGECFRDAALSLLKHHGADKRSVVAIGSHGQTLRHQPRASRPFTLQIGDPNIISAGTHITTVADFRRRDIATGGEGAPLAPAFHQWLFSNAKIDRAVVNIGGIANVTILPSSHGLVSGFDTGPGNTLMDGWSRLCRSLPFDKDGSWSKSGTVCEALLKTMLADHYFSLAPPKSTGFEYFSADWTREMISSTRMEIASEDVQATLTELSARSIATAILDHTHSVTQVLVCGGGVHNSDLMQRLAAGLPDSEVVSTEKFGLHPDWVEAAAFAWLAKRRIEGLPGNLPEVTGACGSSVLGAIYPA